MHAAYQSGESSQDEETGRDQTPGPNTGMSYSVINDAGFATERPVSEDQCNPDIGPVVTLWFISFILCSSAIILGTISLTYFQLRNGWQSSNCTITNYTLDSKNTYSNGRYQVVWSAEWDVVYRNRVVDRTLNGVLVKQLASHNQAFALEDEYSVGTTHVCYYDPDDFTLDWSLPYYFWKHVAWASAITGVGSVSAGVVLTYMDLAAKRAGRVSPVTYEFGL